MPTVTDWDLVESNLPAAIQAAAADADLQVEWGDLTAVMRDPTYVNLSFLSLTPAGRDERRGEVGATQITERIYGARVLTIQANIDSQDQPFTALRLADRIVAGLHSETVASLLLVMGLGLSTTSAPRYVPYKDSHDRMRSAAIVDIAFNACISHELDPIDFVDRVSGTGLLGQTFDTDDA